VKSATPGSASTTSDQRSSGVTADSKTTWSALSAGGSANKKSQKVTKEFEFSNISPVAGQLKLTIELDGFDNNAAIKINGQALTTSIKTAQMTARLESEKWGGSKIHVTLKMPAGSESSPSKLELELEVDGKFTVHPDE